MKSCPSSSQFSFAIDFNKARISLHISNNNYYVLHFMKRNHTLFEMDFQNFPKEFLPVSAHFKYFQNKQVCRKKAT